MSTSGAARGHEASDQRLPVGVDAPSPKDSDAPTEANAVLRDSNEDSASTGEAGSRKKQKTEEFEAGNERAEETYAFGQDQTTDDPLPYKKVGELSAPIDHAPSVQQDVPESAAVTYSATGSTNSSNIFPGNLPSHLAQQQGSFTLPSTMLGRSSHSATYGSPVSPPRPLLQLQHSYNHAPSPLQQQQQQQQQLLAMANLTQALLIAQASHQQRAVGLPGIGAFGVEGHFPQRFLSAASSSSPPVGAITGRPPKILYMNCDDDSLSEYQCLVRQQIELFEAMREDVESNAQGRNRPIVLGQVGIRCRHCSTLSSKSRARSAVYYPARLTGLYQAAQNMATSHLADLCPHVPQTIRMNLAKLRDRKSSAGGGKKYWAEAARAHGVLEDSHGLRFEKPR